MALQLLAQTPKWRLDLGFAVHQLKKVGVRRPGAERCCQKDSLGRSDSHGREVHRHRSRHARQNIVGGHDGIRRVRVILQTRKDPIPSLERMTSAEVENDTTVIDLILTLFVRPTDSRKRNGATVEGNALRISEHLGSPSGYRSLWREIPRAAKMPSW